MSAIQLTSELVKTLTELAVEDRVPLLNEIRAMLHEVSPFKAEPVDCVQWVPADSVTANDYNPNAVAPPEMELLRHSVMEDGFTQPIVAWQRDDVIEVVDGFHRNRVGKECEDVRERIHNYLPVAIINAERSDRSDRIASTIRHNRARGKHKITAMSEIVVELKNRNWANKRIARELGMEDDEVLRLLQITGLESMFSDQEFSASWDVEGEITVDDFEELTDDIESYSGVEARTVNTSDDNRIFHQYTEWECYKAGFYATTMKDMSKEQCEQSYANFLSDLPRFTEALNGVISSWKKSCEHYLTNSAMNRIAWLGQAAICYDMGIPSTFRGGFSLLTDQQQDAANKVALEYLNIWLNNNNCDTVTMDVAYSGRQSDIY